ncbi:uncharacterized protein LOC115766780 [Drosophila novamexicana]|uniref:uncharacterized protein LOC115766780 n=1 Tax=Drosophila novamexicana TaxID=47314 RepID=UPI0011E5B58A|nr:uncharacterized protein LOC115766780 [Drosophila novamexicana]
MDSADFWQQARAPFALHTAATALHQHQHQHTQQHPHPLSSQQEQHANPTNNNNHLPLNSKLEPNQVQQQEHPHQQQTHQQQQQQQQQPQQQQPQLLQHHVEQCYSHESFEGQQSVATAPTSTQLSNHHLLFNAAAAAAAAAHLKSTALNNHAQNNITSSNANSTDQMDNPLPLPIPTLSNHSLNSSGHLAVKTKQEHDQQQQHSEDPRPQPSEQTYSASFYAGPSEQRSQLHQQHQQQQPHQPRSPLLTKTISQGQQSPQHSITPSGGSSTPDIKYNNEKMANEIQLQLSRSSSAAAISERTLEECWSTLQRLFMHKSAMQQIQQQIPRVGLGAHGVASTASMGSGTTPGAETKPHQCQQCMKSFSSNHQLVQHIRVHTGEKPYKCSYCDRRFKQLSHVQQHTRLHTGERPYKCHLPDCGRAFIQLSNLQQHLRNHDAQVERAKNRPFHCNICGKGFATESSLRTHTSKELQLHLGVLQQHAALIGGPNATSCPVCHKLFLGTDALLDHMKHVHKEKSPTPTEPPAQFGDSIHSGSGNGGAGPGSLAAQCASELNCAHPSTTSGSSLNDSYLGKRRTANHPCPVCGKHYVNEGSLRKHLACHAETSQLTSSLRMWPCSVCQAVFTHENGLLTHMDHMRMDPKHQFAAQYVLSRAAAEQRERESLLAATLAASSTSSGIRETTNILPLGVTPGGSNSLCPSPSANSECSSNGRLSSSSASDQEQDQGLSENENSSHNNNNSSANNNNNIINNNNNNCNSSKINLNELRLPNSSQYSMDAELHANRMSLMAAASAAAAAVAASASSRSHDGTIDAATTGSGSAVVQAAVVNLAAAMRMNNSANHQQQPGEHQLHQQNHQHQAQHQHQHPHHQQQLPHLPLLSPLGSQQTHPSNNNTRRSPTINVPSLQMQTDTSSVMMSMMRSSLDSGLGGIHQMEALHHQHHQASTYSQHAVTPSSQQASSHPQHTHHPETALRMHQQAEAILRSHTEAAFRLAASVAATNGSNANSTSTSTGTIKSESSAHQQRQINGSELHSSPHRFQSNASQPHPHPQPQSQQEQQPNPHNS